MDINNLIYTDEALSVIDSGMWTDAGDEAPGVKFFVTGFQAKHAQSLMRQKQAAARLKNRGKPLSEEQNAQCTKEVIVESVLKDWQGLESNGEPVPYSIDTARNWIMSRNGELFTMLVLSAAKWVDAQASELSKALAKNSQPASDGASTIQTL